MVVNRHRIPLTPPRINPRGNLPESNQSPQRAFQHNWQGAPSYAVTPPPRLAQCITQIKNSRLYPRDFHQSRSGD